MKKKVIISACLLGENCRYDGKTKASKKIIETYGDYEIIPFCPEAPIFGTPRERISVIHVDGKNRIFTDETSLDVTNILEDEINSFIKLNKNIDEIVLKSKSPSCGIGTAPVLNKEGELLSFGDGVAAGIFKKKYVGIKIIDENF